MMIKKFLSGFLKNVNSKPNKINAQGNLIPAHVLGAIREIQKSNPKLLLCGSAALILAGILPYREMHDIDFVVHEKDFDDASYWSLCDPYEGECADGYTSHVAYRHHNTLNALVHNDEAILRSEELILYKGAKPIACQNLQDILKWKEKYNRPKDIKDIENITSKALEDAVFGG